MAEDNLDRIIAILKDMNKIYKELLSLSIKKKDFIIEGKVNQIDNILKFENAAIVEISKQENERELAINGLASDYGIPKERLTVSYLCEELKDNRCMVLREETKSITDTLTKLKEVNDLNGRLIEQSLDYINFSVDLITSSLEPIDGVYEAKEGDNKKEKINLFDAKA